MSNKRGMMKVAPVARGAEAKPTYDVAISFLLHDEAIGRALYDLLAEGLNVFFFPRKQEELAGTDGLESMREPFATARVVVVLYRQPWGDTNWTRVEQAAITDRFLREGWDWLLFVQLDKESALPPWLPETHVRFALEQYGVEQLAGAMKARVQRRGGAISLPTALSQARRVQAEASRLADEKSYFGDRKWIEANIHREVERIMRRIIEFVEEIKTKFGMTIEARTRGLQLAIRDNRVGAYVAWRQGIFNTVAQQAELIAGTFNGPVFLHEERMVTVFQPKELGRSRFTPTLSMTREVRWLEVAARGEARSSEETAHRILGIFLDLLDQANRGTLNLMHI